MSYTPSYVHQKNIQQDDPQPFINSQEINISRQSIPARNPLSTEPDIALFLMSAELSRSQKALMKLEYAYKDLNTAYTSQQAQFLNHKQETHEVISRYQNEQGKLSQMHMSHQEEIEFWKEKYAGCDQGLGIRLEQSLKKLFETENQLNELRENYKNMEKRKDMEIQEQKSQIESRRQSMLNREIRELTIKFQADKSQIVAENNRLKDVIDLRTQEIEEWTMNYNQLEDSMNNYKKSDQKSFELNQKNQSLTKELEMANYNLSIKNQQFEQLKNQNRELELQLSQQKKDFTENLRHKDQECMEETIRSNNLRKELEGLRLYELRFKESDEKKALLASENQRLNQILSERIAQLEGLTQQYNSQTIQWKQTEQKKNQLQENVGYLTNEFDRVNEILNAKADEIQQYKSKAYQLETQLQALQKQEQESEQRIQWLLKELNTFRSKQGDLEGMVNQLKLAEAKIAEYENKLQILGQEIDRLNGNLRFSSQENEKLVVQCRNLEATISHYKDYELQCRENEKHMSMFGQEIDRLKVSLHDKVKENDNLKQDIFNLQQNQLRIDQQEEIILRQRRDIEELQLRLRDSQKLQALLREKESQMLLLSQEIERISVIMQQKKSEYESLRQRCFGLENENNELVQQVQSIAYLSEEIDRLNGIITDKDKELINWRGQYVDQNGLRQRDDLCLFVILFVEIESLRNRIMHKENEIDTLRRSQLASIMVKKQ